MATVDIPRSQGYIFFFFYSYAIKERFRLGMDCFDGQSIVSFDMDRFPTAPTARHSD